MGDRSDATRYLENWQDEVDSAAEYRAMAAGEPDPRLAKVYANLAAMEESHIAFWENRLRIVGTPVPPRRPSWRSRILAGIARRFGPELVLATIAAKEEVDQNTYVKQLETASTRMSAQERWHARVLKQLVATQRRGLEGSFLGRLEGRHRSVGGNALRAAVLGANDGLCSNLSLVMGVAGASVDSQGILITGLAGLLAGACSMALGEWVSVTSARELAQREIRIESSELAEDPEAEGEELKLIYEAKGLSPSEADGMGQALARRSDVRHRRADPRGAGHRPARARRLGVGSGGHLVRPVRDRSSGANPPVYGRAGEHRGGDERYRQCGGPVCDWRGDHGLHGSTDVAVGRPSAPAGPCGGRIDIRCRQTDRHGDPMTARDAATDT